MKRYREKIQKVCPVFTDEILNLLENWIKEEQHEEVNNFYEELMQNQDFANLIYDITHLKSYTKPQS